MNKLKRILLGVILIVLLYIPSTSFASNKIDVNIKATLDGENTNIVLFDDLVDYGSTFNVSKNNHSDNFAFWIVNGVVEEERLEATSFVATRDFDAVLVLYSGDKDLNIYIDHSGKLLDARYDGSLTDKEPSKPNYEFNGFTNVYEKGNVTLFKATYLPLGDKTANITFNGNKVTYNYNEIVTLQGEEGKAFSEEGKILTYDTSYTFSALYDRTIDLVDIDEVKPLINISHNLNLRLGYITKSGQFYLPEGYEFIEAGFLLSESEEDILDFSNSTIAKAKSILNTTNEYLISFDNIYHNNRAYLTYKYNGNIETIYSKIGLSEHIEDFEHLNLTSGTSYNQNFNYTLKDGSLWEINNVRNQGDDLIDGKGIMMRQLSDDSYIQSTFINGFNMFSFEYRKAFTGSNNRNYKVSITNNSITNTYDIPIFGSGSGSQDNIYTWNYQGEPLTGITIIKVYVVGASSNQATFDNFKWTSSFEGASIDQIPNHTITFKDGQSILDTREVRDGKKVELIESPTKLGYDFKGWLLEENPFDINMLISEDITLVANFEENDDITLVDRLTYTIDFGSVNISGGYDTSDVTFTNTKDSKQYILNKQRVQIYNVSGKTSPHLIMAPVNSNQVSFVEIDLRHLVRPSIFEIDLTTRTNKINISNAEIYLEYLDEEDWIPVLYDDVFNIAPKIDRTSNNSFSFEIDKSAIYRTYYYSPNTNTTNTTVAIDISEIRIYEKHETLDGNLVVYEYNNGDKNTYEYIMNNGKTNEPNEPEKYIHDFDGWFIGSNQYNFNSNVSNDLVITAKWTRNKYEVIFDYGHLGAEREIFYVQSGGKVSELATPNRDNYNFKHWIVIYRNKDNDVVFDFNNNITEDIILMAKWELQPESELYHSTNDEDISNYYTGLDSSTNKVSYLTNLLQTTHNRTVNYGDARQILAIADRHPHDPSQVLVIYDRNMVFRPWNHPNWEREHVWPNSKLGVLRADNSTTNQAADLHNLRAIIPVVNQRRSNRYFVSPDLLNTPIGHTIGEKMYYPGDEDKGDVARIFLYMALMYDDVLMLTDNDVLLNYGDVNKINNNPVSAYMGLLSLLYDWHLKDPVDDFEISRNNVIHTYQGNRNPFIDHPELFEIVWEHLNDLDFLRTDTPEKLEKPNVDRYNVHYFVDKRREYLI